MMSRELRKRCGVTSKALRYYEAAGVVVPSRLPNGYRDYPEVAVRQVRVVRCLTSMGLSVAETRPFVDCLATGHVAEDECPSSMAAYRNVITRLTEQIGQLAEWRVELTERLARAAGQAIPVAVAERTNTTPERLVRREPTGLRGRPLPNLGLESTDGEHVVVDALRGTTVLYLYPMTGRPDVDLPDGWDSIPGAVGCTAQACGFRDHHGDLVAAGAGRVYGVSSQDSGYQKEVVRRLGLPFAMLSDPTLRLARDLGLPTFVADGQLLFERMTLVVVDGVIDHVWHPVPEPAAHAGQVLDWLRNRQEMGP